MNFTPSAENSPEPAAPTAAPERVPPRKPQATPPPLDLWMIASLAFLPGTACVLCNRNVGWPVPFTIIVFTAIVGGHCLVRRIQGLSGVKAALTGAFVLPAIIFITSSLNFGFRDNIPGLLCGAIGFALLGWAAGVIVTKQFEAVYVVISFLRFIIYQRDVRASAPSSIREQLDDATTPLEAPPGYGLPRRFGVRGMLIATFWAALLMGFLRVLHSSPWVYFMSLTFVAGTLAAQVMLFGGASPINASMWAGAILLPGTALAVKLMDHGTTLAELACWPIIFVPAGIALGATVGGVAGSLYLASEEFLLWITRGLPNLELEPISETDANVLLEWIVGPKICRRWAGDQLTWPLDREQLLRRFGSAAGERPPRRIYKAVNRRTGAMIGYVELGSIDYEFGVAWIELPLVDPSSGDRPRLTLLLLRALAHEAFRRVARSIIVSAADPLLRLSCVRAWKFGSYYCYSMPNGGERWTTKFER